MKKEELIKSKNENYYTKIYEMVFKACNEIGALTAVFNTIKPKTIWLKN